VLESFPQPGQVGLVALGVFFIVLRRAPQAVVAAHHVNREEGHAAVLPAHILPVFREQGVRASALPGQRNLAFAEAVLVGKEERPQFRQPLEWIAALDSLGVVTISPLVIAGRIDQGMNGGVELGQPARLHVIAAAEHRPRKVADMDDKRQGGILVEVGENVVDPGFVLGEITEIADKTEAELLLLRGGLSLQVCSAYDQTRSNNQNGQTCRNVMSACHQVLPAVNKTSAGRVPSRR
jgi:hypothetical protein